MFSRTLLYLSALLSFSLASSFAFGQDVTIVSPATDRAVSSPVRVVAEFPGTAAVNTITVSVDNVELLAGSATPLDMRVPMSEGDHLLTVRAVQSDGRALVSSRWVKVAASTATAAPSSTSSTLVFPNIEEMPGWYTYPDWGTRSVAPHLP